MKKTIKKLHDVKDGEIFELVKPLAPGTKTKMIRLRGTKHNALCLSSYVINQLNFNEEVKIVGKLEMNFFNSTCESSRFDDLFNAAVSNLVEYYEELNNVEIVMSIKQRVEEVDTGNDQNDYERIRNIVEKFVQNWIVDRSF
jgi:hypothetical protein